MFRISALIGILFLGLVAYLAILKLTGSRSKGVFAAIFAAVVLAGIKLLILS